MALTRNDVARTAGVSPAVVSYVLNNGPRPVSAAARRRVEEAIRELDYRPDGLARSLRVGRTNTLGLVMPDGSNPFFAELARAIEDIAYERGFAVLVCNSADDLDRERAYITGLAERRIDGLIVVSTTAGQDLSAMTSLSIPVVALDRSPDDSPISTIRSDNAAGAAAGTRHLLEHGHTTVALVAGPETATSRARRDGWMAALAASGAAPGSEFAAPFTYDGGESITRQWAATTMPAAALVASDVQAVGILAGLAAQGIRVPQDVAIVSIDGTRAGRYAVPSLTSVEQPIVSMAAAAVAHLVDTPADPIHLAMPTTLRLGRSCGCCGPQTNLTP